MNSNKIYVCQESWNDSFNWWNPNTYPINWIDRTENGDTDWGFKVWEYEAKKQNKYHDINSIVTFPGSRITDPNNCDLKMMLHYGIVQTCTYNEIPKDEKYFYIVQIPGQFWYDKFFEFEFKYVNPKILEDIKNNRAVLFFIDKAEGYVTQKQFDYMNKVCFNNGIRHQQAFFYHCNTKLSVSDNTHILTYLCFNDMVNWIKEKTNDLLGYNPESTKNIFLSYNRRVTVSRVKFLLYLFQNNLQDRGYWSYGGNKFDGWDRDVNETLGSLLTHIQKYPEPSPDSIRFSEEERELCNRIDRMAPVIIDSNVSLDSKNHYLSGTLGDKDLHERSFLTIVSETLFSNESVYFSEKTYRPISSGHPFMLVGSPFSLKALQKMGFKTFHQYWDESYDECEKLDDRLEIIMNNLKMLSQFDNSKLIKLRYDILDILKHNQNLYNTLSSQNLYQTLLNILFDIKKGLHIPNSFYGFNHD